MYFCFDKLHRHILEYSRMNVRSAMLARINLILATQWSLIERRSFIKRFVREAVGKDTTVSLEYIFKMLKTGQQRENIGVLSTVYDGGTEVS
jgi:hypothetical protein